MNEDEQDQLNRELHTYFAERSKRIGKESKPTILFIDTVDTLSMHPYKGGEE